jgi:hypothetical protein
MQMRKREEKRNYNDISESWVSRDLCVLKSDLPDTTILTVLETLCLVRNRVVLDSRYYDLLSGRDCLE